MRLTARGVEVVVGGSLLLAGVDLEIASGEVVGVIGPSGSGKTTLLRVLAGLTATTSGTVEIETAGGDRRRVVAGDVAMSFQDDAVYEHLDVEHNLSFPLDLAHAGRDRIERAVDATAGWLGIRRLLPRRADTLSGGERSAVATARAVVPGKASFIALDEPLARTDLRRRAALGETVRRVKRGRPDVGIVIATNDWRDVMPLADRVVFLEGGGIVQIGAPQDLYQHPASVTVAGFLGDPPMNLFPAFIDRGSDGFEVTIGTDHVVETGLPAEAVGRPVVVGVRPEHLALAPPGTPFRHVIHVTAGAVEPTTGVIRFGLGGVASVAYAMRSRRRLPVEVGDRLELTWAADRVCVFDAESGRTIPK